MIRTGEQCIESIRDGREVWINGERVKDVPTHPMFKPLVDIRARIYDMQHDAATSDKMTYVDEQGERQSTPLKLPYTQADWQAKRAATDTVLDDIHGVVTRVGDETIGEMWSLFDGKDVLNEVDPQFSANIRNHIDHVLYSDPFHVSANTDPKGDRSKPPQEQDPDMLLHVVKETDAGILVRGAKFETAAAYANQAFTKPTIANWAGGEKYSDYAVGFICDLGSPGIKMICHTGFAGRAPIEDYPLANRFAGNLLAHTGVPAAMVEAFESTSGLLAERLLAALQAAIQAGGEAGPVHAMGLKVVEQVSWPVIDLRVDWSDNPLADLERLWAVYQPQQEAYVTRALNPADSPSYGVPGDP